jgi:Putative prokaryotic signal transducing protein
MFKLMLAPNTLIGQHWVNLLAVAGIPCELHNRYLNGALGEIPADQCAPELWLVDERDEVIARKLIDRAVNGPPAGAAPWRCSRCGETLEPQFTVCWQCGTERDPREA